MMMMQEKEAQDKKEAVQQFFPLIFPYYKIMITPRSIILTKDEETIMIDENNFEAL